MVLKGNLPPTLNLINSVNKCKHEIKNTFVEAITLFKLDNKSLSSLLQVNKFTSSEKLCMAGYAMQMEKKYLLFDNLFPVFTSFMRRN